MWPVSDARTFGQRIRELRKARNIDQRTLAERVEARLQASGGRGFDVTYLSKIENARVDPPSTPAIIALGEELGADVYELIALAGKVPPAVGETLKVSEGARIFYRSAIDLSLSEEDWQHLLAEARRLKGQA
jgi:transcriptional regulator with XRE-family HTH domain